ncbi:MAG: thiamine diphosphokinase [Lachnospiraceae bacterium]|nr:thiamine diphosphokinase [Lachnospiraceae bacterium]
MEDMQDTVIVAGGTCDLTKYEDILGKAYLIGADRGALYLADLGYRVDLSVGDFDSVSKAEYKKICNASKEVEKLYPEKDDTDLEHAIKRAIDTAPGTIHIIGATGTRLDQTFCAINLLMMLHKGGREAYIHDEHNRIRLIEGKAVIKRDGYRYVSLIPCDDTVTDVSLSGFKYSGEHITLDKHTSLGISNEIEGDLAQISCGGCLFIFESND